MLTTEQRQARKAFCGSSDAPAIMGVDPYRNRHDVFLSKTRDLDDFTSPAIEAGNILEPLLIDWCGRQLDRPIRNRGGTFVKDVLGCNLDADLSDTEIIEAKTTGLVDGWGDEGTDEIPDKVLVQVHHAFHVTGAVVAYVPVILAKFSLRFALYRVERNDKVCEAVAGECTEFMRENVMKGIAPVGAPTLDVVKRVRREPATWCDVPDELVLMASRVKTALENEARNIEGKALSAASNYQAEMKRVDGVDLSAEHDSDALQARLVQVSGQAGKLAEQRKNGLSVKARADKAREALAAAGAGSQSIAELQTKAHDASAAVAAEQREVHRLRQLLSEAEGRLEVHATAMHAANKAVEVAKRHAEALAAWHLDIDAAAGVYVPAEDEVEAANDEVTEARQAIEQGVKVRTAIAAKSAAEAYAREQETHSNRAARLRAASRETQDILTDAIARIEGCPLKVRITDDGEARLVLEHKRGPETPFEELSDGERWPIVVALAAASNRLIVLPQAAFGELSNTTRKQLHALAQEHGCYILTAQVDEGPLRAELFDSTHAMAEAA